MKIEIVNNHSIEYENMINADKESRVSEMTIRCKNTSKEFPSLYINSEMKYLYCPYCGKRFWEERK